MWGWLPLLRRSQERAPLAPALNYVARTPIMGTGHGARGSAVRVGYDGTPYMEPMTGTGQYARALWQEFVRGVPGIEPVMLLAGPRESWPEVPGGELVVEEPPRRFAAGKARKLWWEQVGLPRAA